MSQNLGKREARSGLAVWETEGLEPEAFALE